MKSNMTNLIDLHNEPSPAPTKTVFAYFVITPDKSIRLTKNGRSGVIKVNKVFNQLAVKSNLHDFPE